MATINFFIKGNKDPSTIYVRFRHGRNHDYTKSIKKLISPKDWSDNKKLPHPRNTELKNLTVKIEKLSRKISDGFNESDLDEIDGQWLENLIDVFNKDPNANNKEIRLQSDLISNNIENLINSASSRENGKGGFGLSKSRINSYKNLKRIFLEFQGSRRLKIRDVDMKLGRDFLSWMLNEKGYAESYSRKKIDDLKTVCNDAQIQGISVNSQLRKVKGGKSKNPFIVYLSVEELNKIKQYDYKEDHLKNAVKWLLLGCDIGQRGGDLLNITEKNFVRLEQMEVIELTQQKTGKLVTIPILPTTKELIKTGLPKKITPQKFNEYLKKICELAEIDEVIEGSLVPESMKKESKQDKRKVVGHYQKWKLISSHVCRRTFATNHYGILPTPLIMQITGHSSEKMLLNYIGKNSYDYAHQIVQFYKSLNTNL